MPLRTYLQLYFDFHPLGGYRLRQSHWESFPTVGAGVEFSDTRSCMLARTLTILGKVAYLAAVVICPIYSVFCTIAPVVAPSPYRLLTIASMR